MSAYEGWTLDIKWDDTALEGLPTLVGPFKDMREAREWAELNIPNGTAEMRPLGRPYARPTVTRRGDPLPSWSSYPPCPACDQEVHGVKGAGGVGRIGAAVPCGHTVVVRYSDDPSVGPTLSLPSMSA